jgi:hypothetical protein
MPPMRSLTLTPSAWSRLSLTTSAYVRFSLFACPPGPACTLVRISFPTDAISELGSLSSPALMLLFWLQKGHYFLAAKNLGTRERFIVSMATSTKNTAEGKADAADDSRNSNNHFRVTSPAMVKYLTDGVLISTGNFKTSKNCAEESSKNFEEGSCNSAMDGIRNIPPRKTASGASGCPGPGKWISPHR